ncbi:MAG TPA: fused MFS/spermidine synthase, partial [Candidatus Saccharimonadales bacterium]
MLQLLRAHRYELIAFLTGGAVMTLEIVGARLIAPFFGTSIYVWTAMIGVILGSLAVGYWAGGLLADRRNPQTTLVYLLIGASVLVATIGLIQSSVLSAIADLQFDLRLSTFLAACLLFAPASLLIGTVSPHLAKIRIESLETSGRSVGRLEAAGALGSIAGTFLCGYFLLGFVGSRRLVIGVAVLLLLTSLFAYGRGLRRERLGILTALIMIGALATADTNNIRADVDTPYGRYQVIEGQYQGRAAIFLRNDNLGLQSGIAINQPREPLFDYIRRFHDAAKLFGPQSATLVIGGGAYTFPSMLADERLTQRVEAV